MSRSVQWPALPFFKPTDLQPPDSGRECTVELTDGRIVRQELVEFQPGAEVLALRPREGERVKDVPYTHIRSIRLQCPVAYVPDIEALKGVGVTDPTADNRKQYEITLADGSRATLASSHTGQRTMTAFDCCSKSSVEANQPSKRWPWPQVRSKTIIASGRALDSPHLVAERRDAADNDAGRCEKRTQCERRKSRQALADRATERGDAAESH